MVGGDIEIQRACPFPFALGATANNLHRHGHAHQASRFTLPDCRLRCGHAGWCHAPLEEVHQEDKAFRGDGSGSKSGSPGESIRFSSHQSLNGDPPRIFQAHLGLPEAHLNCLLMLVWRPLESALLRSPTSHRRNRRVGLPTLPTVLETHSHRLSIFPPECQTNPPVKSGSRNIEPPRISCGENSPVQGICNG